MAKKRSRKKTKTTKRRTKKSRTTKKRSAVTKRGGKLAPRQVENAEKFREEIWRGTDYAFDATDEIGGVTIMYREIPKSG